MKQTLASVLLACLALLPLGGCKLIGHPDYQLVITVEPGVSGSPAGGVYAHQELESVEYSYAAENPKHTVEVLVDGEAEDAAASVVLYHDTVLIARLFDPRGAWVVTALNASSQETKFTVLLEGADQLAGSFRDNRGYSGTWLAEGGSFALLFTDLEGHKFVAAIPAMSGTWTWDNGTSQGSWSAIRKDGGSFRWKNP